MKRLTRCSIVLLVVAVAAFAASTAFAAPSPDALFSDALGAYKQQNYGKAAVAFEKAAVAYSKAKKPVKAAQAAYNQGFCLLRTGADPKKSGQAFLFAAEQYVKVKDIEGEGHSRIQAAQMFFNGGDLEKSGQQYTAVLKKSKGISLLEGGAEEGLGRIEVKKGNVNGAISYYESAAVRYSAIPSARLRVLVRIAQLKANVGDITGAFALCADVEKESLALSGDPKTKADGEFLRFLAIAERGRIANLMGWYEQARSDLDAAVDLAEKASITDEAARRSVEMNQAKNTMQLGNLLLARELFDRLYAKAKQSGEMEEQGLILASIGQIERMDGRHEKALSLFRQSEDVFRKAGLKTRQTEILGRISNLYYEIGMWNESLTNSSLVLGRALEENNLESVLTTLMRIFRIEAGKVTGLSGKLDFRTAQGMPWKASLTARSAIPGSDVEEHKDRGIARAWKTAFDGSAGFFLTDPSIEGFRVVRESAAFVNWTKVNFQASYYASDAMLRVIASRIRSARKAAEALQGLIEGTNAAEPGYRDDAIQIAFAILRRSAGESLLAGRVQPEDIQTSGIRLEGPDTQEKKKPDTPGLAADMRVLASLVARCSLTIEEQQSLSAALLSGNPIPAELEGRLRRTFFSASEKRLADVSARLGSPKTGGEARKEIAASLIPVLELSSPSLKREMGKLADSEKWRGYVKKQGEKRLEKIALDADALAKTLYPGIVFRLDAAREISNIFGAWHGVQSRLLVVAGVGVTPEQSDSWEGCLQNVADSIAKGRKVFSGKFAIKGKKDDLKAVQGLVQISELLANRELRRERMSLSNFLSGGNTSPLEFEDEIALRELISQYDWTLGSKDAALSGAERILDMLAADRAGAKRRQLKAVANPEMQWRAYGLIGKAEFVRGNIPEAIDSLETALNLMEQINPLEGATSQATADRLDVYRDAVGAAFALWTQKKDAASAEHLWRVVERMKSRQWRELLATTGGSFLASLPKEAREELNALRGKLTAAEGGFRYASFRGDRTKMDQYSVEIQTYRLKINDLTAGRSVDAPRPPEAAAIRELLPQDWNVANYYISDALSFCLLLSKEKGLAVVPLTLDYDSFFGYFVWMRLRENDGQKELLEFDGPKIRSTGKNWNTACGLTPSALYRRLFEPVEKQCGSSRKLLIIPHDILHIFPMETLASSKEGEELRFLVQDWTFAELPSTFLLGRQRKIAPERGMLIVANPIYGSLFRQTEDGFVNADASREWADVIRNEKSPVAQKYRETFRKEGILSGDKLNQEKLFPFLARQWQSITSDDVIRNPLAGTVKRDFAKVINFIRGTQQEADMIASILDIPADSSGFQVRENATEKNLATLPLGEYRLIHFACHGYDRGTIPDLQPGIALSPVNDPENDSFLQMGEMTQLPWNADIVTLSACDTGLGDRYAGDGMLGLSTTLLATGNRGAVLSRWNVPDDSAPVFMRNFYSEVGKGVTGPEAVRKAQIALIREGEFAVPRHWAVFKYIGIPW